MAGFGHKPASGVSALITNIRFEDKFNTRRYRGLPDIQVIAGRTKLATITVEGIMLQDTNFGSLSSTSPVLLTISGGGKSVNGFLTELNIRGSMNEPVTFSATVVGKAGGALTGSSQNIQANQLLFFDQTSLANALSFNLALSWDIFFFYDPEDANWPYPSEEKSFIRTFEGTLTVEDANVYTLGNTLSIESFSVTLGSTSIGGSGYREAITSLDNAEDFFKGGYRILITTLS